MSAKKPPKAPAWQAQEITAPCVVCGDETPHDRREYKTLGGDVKIAYKGRAHWEGGALCQDSREWANQPHPVCPSGVRGPGPS